MVDKYLAREFFAERIEEEYLIPLLGLWDNADDIDFLFLPDKFVLKYNHYIEELSIPILLLLMLKSLKKQMNNLKNNYYLVKR